MRDSTALPKKRPVLILCVLLGWIGLLVLVIWPWVHRVDLASPRLSVLAHINFTIWWIVLLWAFHQLTFQIGSLFVRERSPSGATPDEQPAVVVLYPTCDDFNRQNLLSCLSQNYRNFRVVVCDDSKTERYRREIDAFIEQQRSVFPVSLLRRGEDLELADRESGGFKAGNLNYALARASEEWVLLVDADQELPPGYLKNLMANPSVAGDDGIGFLQGAHEASLDDESSAFQRALGPEVRLFYGRDLALRQAYGFLPMFGHGAMIRRAAWSEIGGFPRVVSEDFAFSLRAVRRNLRGLYLGDVVSFEAVPYDFGGFMVRLRKFAGGTAELFKRELARFLTSRASFTEKWDLIMTLGWYFVMPLLVVNGFLSGYVIHELWRTGTPILHPVLPYFFLSMLLFIFVVHVSVVSRFGEALRFYFWSTAIYTAAMPLAGFTFIRFLLTRRRPTFERTAKNQEATPLRRADSVLMVCLGLAAIVLSLRWLSPFTPYLLGLGTAYGAFPLFGSVCEPTTKGRVGRLAVYVPGILMIAALYTMWRSATL